MSVPSAEGFEIALVREQGGVAAVALVGADGERAVALTADGRRLRLARDRILWSTGLRARTGPDAAVAEELRRLGERLGARAAGADLEPLWEVLHPEVRELSIEDLAPLWSPEGGAEDAAALLRAVAADGLRFRLRGSVVEVRTPEQVAEARARHEAALCEERARKAMTAWIHDGGHDPPPEEASHLVQALKDLAAAAMIPARGDPGAELMEDAGLEPTPRNAFQLLVDRGVFRADENLFVHRYGLAKPFSRAARDQAEALGEVPGGLPGDRLDLRHLAPLTVDDPETVEVDDALTLEPLPDGAFRVGVHIADPAAWIAPGSPLDKEAHRRGTTVYLPERRLPMFPEHLGAGPFSLVEGADRPAMSFLLDVDAAGHLAGFQVARTAVRVARRLDYGEVDAMFGSDAELDRLRELAAGLREQRREAGALMTQLPEVSVKVDADGTIRVKRSPSRSASREMVAEWMVWANHAAARWAWQRRVPVPFRYQDAPDSPIPRDLDPGDVVQALLQTRKLGKTVVDRVPRRHFGLGVDGYVQVTSPIRRYLDLATQRQLGAALAGEPPPLDADGLRDLARHVETVAGRAAIAEAGTREYYLLTWIGRHEGAVIRALVLEDQGDRYRVYLPDYALRVPYRGRRRFEVGEELWVQVQGAEPRAGRLRLKEVDRPARPAPAP